MKHSNSSNHHSDVKESIRKKARLAFWILFLGALIVLMIVKVYYFIKAYLN